MRVTFFLLACVALALPGMARAELKFCNDTNVTTYIAIAYSDGGAWKSEGWWNMEPGECKRPIASDLTNSFYYYYADAVEFEFVDGKYNFCTQNKVFEIIGDDIQDNCSDNGYDTTRFQGIELSGETEILVTLQRQGDVGVTQVQLSGSNTSNESANLSPSDYMSLLQGKWETEDGEITITGDRYFEFGNSIFGFFQFSGDVKIDTSCPYQDDAATYIVRTNDDDSALTYCDEITFANSERFEFVNRFLESTSTWYRIE
ncbi:MAG: DUF1036 domain-containing protein [Pseudomonadota bacterium]